MNFEKKSKYGVDDLLRIMEILRSPGGCPWDIEQTHESIRQNFIEETYEAAEAIDTGDTELLREELGDVLLQVVFHSQMEKEKGAFDFEDVCDGVCKKLVLRHPHVFSDVKAETSAEVLENWDKIKKEEKNRSSHSEVFEGVSKALPSLMRAEKIQGRAGKLGLGYKSLEEAAVAVRDHADSLLLQTRDGGDISGALGELLYAAAGAARQAKADPEQCLEYECDKFIRRFSEVEKLAVERGVEIDASRPDVLISLWHEAQK